MNRRGRLLWPVLGACLWLVAGTVAGADEQATRDKLRQLKARLQQVEAQLTEIRGLHGGVLKKLRAAEKQIGEIQNRSRALKSEQRSLTTRLAKLKDERHSTEQRLQQQRALISKQVRLAYQLGRQSRIKLLLNQQDPASLTRTLTWYDYFNRARTDLVKDWLIDLSRLEQIENETRQASDQLRTSQRALAQQQQRLQQQVAARRQVVARLDENFKSAAARQKKWQREERELESLLRSLLEEIASLEMPQQQSLPFNQRRKQMQWPVRGKRLNAFGGKRGESLRWEGIRIVAGAGDSVKAIHSGRVVFADWLKGSGLLMIIDHGDGYMSLYANNESLLHATGDWVETGETIATVGNSGGRRENSLYFEIRRNGNPVDPILWCARS